MFFLPLSGSWVPWLSPSVLTLLQTSKKTRLTKLNPKGFVLPNLYHKSSPGVFLERVGPLTSDLPPVPLSCQITAPLVLHWIITCPRALWRTWSTAFLREREKMHTGSILFLLHFHCWALHRLLCLHNPCMDDVSHEGGLQGCFQATDARDTWNKVYSVS